MSQTSGTQIALVIAAHRRQTLKLTHQTTPTRVHIDTFVTARNSTHSVF